MHVATPICINLTYDDNGKHAMDVMSRSSVREYLVITELYKGGKRELQTKYTRAAFSMELLFDMQTYAMISLQSVQVQEAAVKKLYTGVW